MYSGFLLGFEEELFVSFLMRTRVFQRSEIEVADEDHHFRPYRYDQQFY